MDDLYEIDDILPADSKQKYYLKIEPSASTQKEDELHIGYIMIDKLI